MLQELDCVLDGLTQFNDTEALAVENAVMDAVTLVQENHPELIHTAYLLMVCAAFPALLRAVQQWMAQHLAPQPLSLAVGG